MENTTLNQQDFFKQYPTASKNFENAKIDWSVLESIFSDYIAIQEDLKTAANYSLNLLLGLSKVHSVSSRVKDAKHLIEKIIRKRSDSNDFDISVENYKSKIHDLIGLRAMHLFKTDWEQIHDGILSKWEIHEKPVANFRDGDSEQFKKALEDKGCELNQHKFGYRSTHYIVKVPIGKQVFFAEIQVRTIYEEAWSEIDHTVRYPYFVNNPIINEFSSISNRLSGMADEMGTFIKLLSEDINSNNKQIDDLQLKVSKLENSIAQSDIDNEIKEKINKELEDVLTHIPQKIESSDRMVGTSHLLNKDIFEMSQRFKAIDKLSSLSNAIEMSINSRALVENPLQSIIDRTNRINQSIGINPMQEAIDKASRMSQNIGRNPMQDAIDRASRMSGTIGQNSMQDAIDKISKTTQLVPKEEIVSALGKEIPLPLGELINKNDVGAKGNQNPISKSNKGSSKKPLPAVKKSKSKKL